MSVKIELQWGADLARGATATLPSLAEFRTWTRAAVPRDLGDAVVVIRVVGEDESAFLNRRYRRKRGPTNVLSFPAHLAAEVNDPLLGDLVICAPVVAREAREQGKTAQAHWAHMTVHGTLHLLGYDHLRKADAVVMEALEVRVLHALGFPNPYSDQKNVTHNGRRRTNP